MKKNTFIKVSDFVFSESYLLLLEVNGNSGNYAIIDTEDNSLKEIGSTDTALSDTDHILYQYNFSTIKVSSVTKSFSFIPRELYSEADDLAAFTGADISTEKIFRSELDEYIKNIYGLDSKFAGFFEDNFSHATLYPQMLSFYKGCKQNDGYFANIKEGNVEILLIKEGQLLFYNIFEYKNDEELQYFILLGAQQHQLDNNSTMLKISGEVAEYSLSFERLKTIFPKVEFNIPTGIEISEDFANINLHRYFSLLNMRLCE